jgi:citrate lyase gamma subunit
VIPYIWSITRQMNIQNHQFRRAFFVLISISIGLTACLKDDFSKITDSEWNPDLAFPLVNSTLTSYNIFLQDGVPPQFDPDLYGLVRLVYDSDNYSRRASELIQLPLPLESVPQHLSPENISAFNANNTNGFTFIDSSSFSFSYSLDAVLGANSSIDSILFKQGFLKLKIQPTFPHNAHVRVEIPQLIVQNQPFLQEFQFTSTGESHQNITVDRNLQNAYLIPGSSESVLVKVKYTIERTNPALLFNNSSIGVFYSFNDCSFTSLHGNFGSFQMPIVSNDSIHLGIFRNAIDATELMFENTESKVYVQNSTGIPLNYTMQSFKGIRQGANIPLVDLSGYTFPSIVPAHPYSSASPNQRTYVFNGGNSNFPAVVNFLPRHMLVSGIHSFAPTNTTNGYLKDTSRVRVYSKVLLPLDGLTIDLQLRDTLDFQFESITREIEEVLLRLNVDNGFPISGSLQVYFGRQNELTPHGTVVITDSLFSAGNLPVMNAADINADGKAISKSQLITDVIVTGQKWTKLKNAQCNRLIIKSRLNSNELGSVIVKVYDEDALNIRIGARIKVRKTL